MQLVSPRPAAATRDPQPVNWEWRAKAANAVVSVLVDLGIAAALFGLAAWLTSLAWANFAGG